MYQSHHNVPLSYDLTTFYILGQKFVKFFVVVLENLRLLRRHSEINWPLERFSSSWTDSQSFWLTFLLFKGGSPKDFLKLSVFSSRSSFLSLIWTLLWIFGPMVFFYQNASISLWALSQADAIITLLLTFFKTKILHKLNFFSGPTLGIISKKNTITF